MTSVSLNQPRPSLHGDQNQLFTISPNNQDSTSLSYHTLFNVIDPRQTLEFRENDQEGNKVVLYDGSSSSHQVCNLSFIPPEPVMVDPRHASDHNLSLYKNYEEDSKKGHGSKKWMSSKMRLMKKMMRPNSSPSTVKAITIIPPRFQNQVHENRHCQRSPYNNGNNTPTRVCSDCSTSSSPLWRSGPNGPKSLCNACGIRQRKARRAMAEAANGLATESDASSPTKTRVHNKEKKSRTNHFAQFKNKCKSTAITADSSQGERKLECFKDFALSLRNNSAFQQVFPRDEVAEAALLLMDLSCGFV